MFVCCGNTIRDRFAWASHSIANNLPGARNTGARNVPNILEVWIGAMVLPA